MSPAEFEEMERRVADRDAAAFSALEDAYTNLVRHFVFTKVGSLARARHITEHVFERAWEHIDRYPWRDFSFHVWILRIARDEIDEAENN